jgi:hypothetical protein
MPASQEYNLNIETPWSRGLEKIIVTWLGNKVTDF